MKIKIYLWAFTQCCLKKSNSIWNWIFFKIWDLLLYFICRCSPNAKSLGNSALSKVKKVKEEYYFHYLNSSTCTNKFTYLKQIGVVYFDWCLCGVHSKHWSKYAFFTFFARKMQKGTKRRQNEMRQNEMRQNEANKGVRGGLHPNAGWWVLLYLLCILVS